jgi:hypothetical protein
MGQSIDSTSMRSPKIGFKDGVGRKENASCSKVAATFLFQFQRLEQRFEVTFAKRFAASPANDLKEHRGAILKWFRKDLKQITLVIAIDQQPEDP